MANRPFNPYLIPHTKSRPGGKKPIAVSQF